jgi:protein-disulfide isomerase
VEEFGITLMHHRLNRRLALRGAAAATALAALSLSAAAQEADAPDAAGTEREVVEMTLGDPDAPVTFIEYASLTCPHCAAFHEEVFPRLKADYIDQGLVRFVAREVYFDRPGLWGAMIARCAGEDRYFGVVDLLFENQESWSRVANMQEVVEGLYVIGRQAGMTRETMDACLSDAAFAEALVAEYQANATADGIESTPSFVINGEKTNNRPWPELEAMIQEALPD